MLFKFRCFRNRTNYRKYKRGEKYTEGKLDNEIDADKSRDRVYENIRAACPCRKGRLEENEHRSNEQTGIDDRCDRR